MACKVYASPFSRLSCLPCERLAASAPRDLCQPLLDSIDRVLLTSRSDATDRTSDVRPCLREVHKCLEASTVESRKLLSRLVAADVPARLIARLGELDFEAQKEAMRVFDAVLKMAVLPGEDGQRIVQYVRAHQRILILLLEGHGDPELFPHCARMLRSCTRHPQLVVTLLDAGAAGKLIELARHPNFDISSEAFSSLRALLLSHKVASADYLQAHLADFFGAYNGLLQVADYVTQRQALRLLGEMLLDRAFIDVMIAYVGNGQHLQIIMNLLRDKSKAIQIEAFHVFKIFAANPRKPSRVQQILYQNKDRIVKLLDLISTAKEANVETFLEDISTVTRVLQALEPPPRREAKGSVGGG